MDVVIVPRAEVLDISLCVRGTMEPSSTQYDEPNRITTMTTAIVYDEFLTVLAYRAAFRSGEIARVCGARHPQIPAHVMAMVNSPAIWDTVEQDNVYAAICDGFDAGVAGEPPLDAVQIAIHYD